MKYIIGIDIGGTTIKFGLFDESLELIDKFAKDTPNNRDEIFRVIEEEVHKIISDNDLSITDVMGIGVGIPGPVKDNFIIKCPNLDLSQVSMKDELEKRFACSVFAANDASLALLGELTKMEYENAVMLTLGTGVGGAVIINGDIIEGSLGFAGEIGHLQIDHKYNLKCGCGQIGCLETVASATGIVNLLKEHKVDYPHSKLTSISTSYEIMNAAMSGEKLAKVVVDEYSKYIARAIREIAVVVNPDVFLIGGGVSNAGSYLLKHIQEAYRKLPGFNELKEAKIRLAELRNDAGIYGAAMFVKKRTMS